MDNGAAVTRAATGGAHALRALRLVLPMTLPPGPPARRLRAALADDTDRASPAPGPEHGAFGIEGGEIRLVRECRPDIRAVPE
ncbi:hypothetical protein GCM10023324_63300 [Streptomyces youssoufiensis]